MTPSKSAMNFNGNDDHDFDRTATGGAIPTSVTHDEHLNFGGDPDLTKK
jgi:hypothetical protein